MTVVPQTAAFVLERSFIQVSGKDACDFLNRLGSGETRDLQSGQLAATLFMRGDGRMVGFADCVRKEEDEWLLVCEREVGQSLFEHLDRMHFTEKVTISAAEPINVWMQYGSGAATDSFSSAKSYQPYPVGMRLLTEAGPEQKESGGELARWLQFRIETGIPSASAELREPVVPLEANLKHAISFTKGCFPGQEVVARIENLGHPANVMVGLKFESEVSVDSELFLGEKRIGRVTSVSMEESGCIALGFVKWACREPGTGLIANSNQQNVAGEVVVFEGMWK